MENPFVRALGFKPLAKRASLAEDCRAGSAVDVFEARLSSRFDNWQSNWPMSSMVGLHLRLPLLRKSDVTPDAFSFYLFCDQVKLYEEN